MTSVATEPAPAHGPPAAAGPADLDVELAAFQIDAVLAATNIALRLGDTGATDRARRVVEGFLVPRRSSTRSSRSIR